MDEMQKLSNFLMQFFDIHQQMILSVAAMKAAIGEKDAGFEDRYQTSMKSLVSGELGQQLSRDKSAFLQVLGAMRR